MKDLPNSIHDELEARITALLLGELPDEEAAALRQAIQQDAELAKLHERLAGTIGLVREAAISQSQPLQLSSERRAKLFQAFKTVRPKQLSVPRVRIARRELMSMAAMLVILALLVGYLVFLPTTRRERFHVAANGEEQLQQRSGAGESYAVDTWGRKQSPPARPRAQAAQFGDQTTTVSSSEGQRALSETLDEAPAGTGDREATDWAAREEIRRLAPQATTPAIRTQGGSGPQQMAENAPAGPGGGGGGFAGGGGAGNRSEAKVAAVEESELGQKPNVEDSLKLSDFLAPYQKVDDASAGVPASTPQSGVEAHYFKNKANGQVLGEDLEVKKSDRYDGVDMRFGVLPEGGTHVAGTIAGSSDHDFRELGGMIRTNGSSSSWALNSGATEGQSVRYYHQARRDLESLEAAKFAATNFYSINGVAAGDISGVAEMDKLGKTRNLGRSESAGKELAPIVINELNYNTPEVASGNKRAEIVLPQAAREDSVYKDEIRESESRSKLQGRTPASLAKAPTPAPKNEPVSVDPATGLPVDELIDAKKPAPAERESQLRLERAHEEADEDVRKPKASTPAPVPQPEVQTRENPFSTFSLNVSDVSFKLAAAALEKGVLPEAATIRSEEFINAFDYRDPEPPAGVPVAFAWERARYPFAHNRDLLRFSVKTAATGRQAGRPVNLVLLLDNSGSMERADRVSIIRECVRVLGNQLQAEDRVSVVAFSRTPRLWIDGLAGTQGSELQQRLGSLAPEGGTNIEEGMKLAYETARRHFMANGINRVVLLTDGAANLGNVEPEALKKKVETHRKQGIALDCFGIGWEGYNDDLLEVLSRNGDGRYGFVNTPEAAATEFAGQLVGALQVAASDVKVQVEFNPRRVTTYRQIGYAKHQLQKEQFRDNRVDAAEIAAAEAGNALYVIQVDPRGEGPIGVVRVRYKVPGTTDYREHEWSVPASGAVAPLDQAGHAIRLAGAAAAFSEWLAASPFAGEVTPERLLSSLSGVADTYGADPRPKKLEWMIRQSMSIAGNR